MSTSTFYSSEDENEIMLPETSEENMLLQSTWILADIGNLALSQALQQLRLFRLNYNRLPLDELERKQPGAERV